MAERFDAVVIGAGPNGLAAAVALARAGRSVLVLEGRDQVGGGLQSGELTLPGFLHDICSAIHPMGAASPFFRRLPLWEHGLEWVHPDVPLAHPLDDGSAAVLDRSLAVTADSLHPDASSYRRLVGPLVANWKLLEDALMGPFLRVPRYPLAMARFGWQALRPASRVAERMFEGKRAPALFAGLAAHGILPLDRPLTASFGMIFAAVGHVAGWPLPRGGSQRIADALTAYLRSLGGQVETGRWLTSFGQLPPAAAYLFDVSPRQLASIAADRLPQGYLGKLERYRYGPGAFKLDYALDGPVPWKAEECTRAGTVHLGGTFDEVAAAEAAVGRGEHPERPFVLLAQQSVFDPSRAPSGRHTAWAYCHVPNGSRVDMSDRIEAQIERFAPGFRDLVLARNVLSPQLLEEHNPNYVGGDIAGGSHAGLQLLGRPTLSPIPYATPNRQIYLCSSSTPPGGGVHGMCGYYAARAALRRSLR
ncbi:MAG: NAD(P)/FAD-dependent oxidoreductase [Actinomycetota bacterium]|nr:NAD(P)/FAD-dependent oxidoreductase [Actinomycetota bacterium]